MKYWEEILLEKRLWLLSWVLKRSICFKRKQEMLVSLHWTPELPTKMVKILNQQTSATKYNLKSIKQTWKVKQSKASWKIQIRKVYDIEIETTKRGFSSLCTTCYILYNVPNTPIIVVELSMSINSRLRRGKLVRMDTLSWFVIFTKYTEKAALKRSSQWGLVAHFFWVLLVAPPSIAGKPPPLVSVITL